MLMCLFQTRNKHAATTLPPFCAIIWLLCCTLAQQHLALTKEHNDSNSSVMRRRISLMIQTFGASHTESDRTTLVESFFKDVSVCSDMTNERLNSLWG